ncbi:hypothetical protein CYMTET_41764 [Cymbomonas tetramitiformis]|uniref:Uncharacterized protein n=1 Tax=Cymbomonas tetramitiformis TaxID=36881 RepID=A0AAE0C7J2_9CHLO|nr:hypothetical protein CYMTET_41764 [Cymbomonas tetramitiformis]
MAHRNDPSNRDISFNGVNITGEFSAVHDLFRLKTFIPWFQQLLGHRQQLWTAVDTTAKLFKKVGQKLQLGATVTIPRQNATTVHAGVIRKMCLAAGRVLKVTEALVVDWDKEDKMYEVSEEEEKDEERERAYCAALRVTKAVEEFPHAFGDELEWSIRPCGCPDIAEHAVEGTLRHAHLCKCPEANIDSLPDPRRENWLEELSVGKVLFGEDAGPGAGDKVANNESIRKQRGVLDAAAKAFNGEYFAFRCDGKPTRRHRPATGIEPHAPAAGGNSAAKAQQGPGDI